MQNAVDKPWMDNANGHRHIIYQALLSLPSSSNTTQRAILHSRSGKRRASPPCSLSHFIGQWGNILLDRQGGSERLLGVPLVRDRHLEERHRPVAEELVHPPGVAVHFV